VLGDGHIKIKHARVDTRLLHGQVATNWSKAIAPDRIIVVSDNVSHDDLRKQLIIEAAPPGIKAHVVPIQKMIDVSKDVRFGDTKAFLLFETPQDALKAIEGGVDIKSLNIGSMAHSQGKIAVNKVLSLDAKDIECFEELKKHGVTFDVRKVPADAPEDMDKLIQIAKDGLGIK
ncbi:MAG: PTS system mannose/fructose/N-acetylgalactosamine-transporter subunit IIB, partial [Lachnospiraceae bacterium]|nr:PTS system mannose/fructose/N-acetylgalactosamine-transporter subunit IIB [Lachnospiraceae bacterium]